MSLVRALVLFSFLCTISGCSQIGVADLSYVNHVGMDFDGALCPKRASSLTSLDDFEKLQASGGCTVCAH